MKGAFKPVFSRLKNYKRYYIDGASKNFSF